jgi:predicted phage-related endonuclease
MIDLALRRQCITSTDVGPIFGVDNYRDEFQVWTEKHGHALPWEPSPRMLLGKDLEQGIVKAYSRITGRQVQWADETVRHPARPWMAASPDALVVGPQFVERVVDAKLVFYDQRRKWQLLPPEGIQLQMWWIMAVTECDVADVVALVGEDEPRIYEIERNREAERVVIAKCEEWHRRYVLGDEVPPITGSKASSEWLQQAFPKNITDIREATDEEVALLEEYAGVRDTRKAAEDRCGEIENQIKLAINDGEGLQWPRGKFTWKKIKDAVEVNWESLAKGLLNEKDKDLAETLLGIHTRPKKSYRKIHFVCEAPDMAAAGGSDGNQTVRSAV